MPSDSLLGQVLIEQKALVNDNKNCWLKSMYKIIEKHNMGRVVEQPEFFCHSYFYEKMQTAYNEMWKTKLWDDSKNQERGNKLRTYRLFKETFCFEEYLDNIKCKSHRHSLTKVRISAHKLEIERGRYKRPPVPLDDRLCKKCTANAVEDEFHIFVCDAYSHLRQKYDVYIDNKEKFVTHMKDTKANMAIYVKSVLN